MPHADGDVVERRLSNAFHLWLAENEDQPSLWSSFDQLVREMLTERLGATRIRCYHVRPGCEMLLTMSQTARATVPKGPGLREGVFGHVATTGKEFVAADPSHGPLLDDLAASSGEDWAWVAPIRQNGVTVGILAVGQLLDPTLLTAEVRQTVGQLVSLFWQHVACLERLRVAQRTDKASGVLTRNDFFTLGRHALAESYHDNEPVVVAVLALEGLRRLDDTGRWRERDALIERLGHLLARRVRSDDLLGRFADDRFVVLLRRLDSGLGRLIAQKMLTTASECVAQLGVAGTQTRLRVGLVGSAFGQPPLEDLLVAAFEALERARKEGVSIISDVPGPKTDGACATGGLPTSGVGVSPAMGATGGSSTSAAMGSAGAAPAATGQASAFSTHPSRDREGADFSTPEVQRS
jgi:GGDEF domain-containing protein